RIKKKLPLRFYFEGNAFLSFTGDMSRRGIFIQTPHPCPAGRGINIEIEGHKEKVTLAGYIIWSKEDMGQSWMLFQGGMGVQLLNYQKQGYQSLLGE
ncbi:MAG: PilZ domain-containing protein, partial [Acidobacteria bacterium]|nr:PilZ domain-containing protein [Acidobacteriota bacterium]